MGTGEGQIGEVQEINGLGSQALLQIFDPELERGNVLFQLCEIALENLAPSAFVGELCLDAA